MFLSEWRKFPSAPCRAGKNNLMTARVSMLLKLCASLTCFRACFLPGRVNDLSAHRYSPAFKCRSHGSSPYVLCCFTVILGIETFYRDIRVRFFSDE